MPSVNIGFSSILRQQAKDHPGTRPHCRAGCCRTWRPDRRRTSPRSGRRPHLNGPRSREVVGLGVARARRWLRRQTPRAAPTITGEMSTPTAAPPPRRRSPPAARPCRTRRRAPGRRLARPHTGRGWRDEADQLAVEQLAVTTQPSAQFVQLSRYRLVGHSPSLKTPASRTRSERRQALAGRRSGRRAGRRSPRGPSRRRRGSSSGRARSSGSSSSSQAIGTDTGAPGAARALNGATSVLLIAFCV